MLAFLNDYSTLRSGNHLKTSIKGKEIQKIG